METLTRGWARGGITFTVAETEETTAAGFGLDKEEAADTMVETLEPLFSLVKIGDLIGMTEDNSMMSGEGDDSSGTPLVAGVDGGNDDEVEETDGFVKTEEPERSMSVMSIKYSPTLSFFLGRRASSCTAVLAASAAALIACASWEKK